MQAKAEQEQMKMQFEDMLNQRDNDTRLAIANIQAQSKIDLQYMNSNDNDGIQETSNKEELMEKMR
jgi:hypothetical protein